MKTLIGCGTCKMSYKKYFLQKIYILQKTFFKRKKVRMSIYGKHFS